MFPNIRTDHSEREAVQQQTLRNVPRSRDNAHLAQALFARVLAFCGIFFLRGSLRKCLLSSRLLCFLERNFTEAFGMK